MSQPSSNLSRRQLRQLRLKHDFELSLSSSSDTDNDSDLITRSLPSMAQPVRLLVCSIGNPGAYLNTLHSAGHTVLHALANSLAYPSFRKSSAYGGGLVSAGSEYTLWQSPSQMNISGKSVAAAWKQFLADTRGQDARLVIVHDELEAAVGTVKVKSGTASARGHNGLKSVREVLKEQDFVRIGVGIGRCESRGKEEVARFVLRKMTQVERGRIEGAVSRVEEELRRLMGG